MESLENDRRIQEMMVDRTFDCLDRNNAVDRLAYYVSESGE